MQLERIKGRVKKSIFSVLILLQIFVTFNLFSQVTPKDSSDINYTQVLFEFPAVKNAKYYFLQVTERQNTAWTKQYKCETSTYIVSNLKFGKIYKWRAIAFDEKNKKVDSTRYYAFRIKGVDLINTNLFRIKLNSADSGNKSNDLIFIDYSRTAINKEGTPVWYLPDIGNKVNATQRIRDLKMTHDGNFTFLTNYSAIECNINGEIVWETPEPIKSKGDSMGFYHHEFTKLKNGNYIVLGTKYVYKEFPDSIKNNSIEKYNTFKNIDGKKYIRIEYGLVYEFTSKKELVWQWDSEDYLSLDDLFHHGNADTIPIVGAHLNSVDVNNENTEILLGFRDLSRVIVIDKKTKEIVESYGDKLFASIKTHQFKNFRFQHDARFLGDSSISLFNNNAIYYNKNLTSSLMIFNRNKFKSQTDTDFNCLFDTITDGRSLKGGSVQKLKNGNFLVCMGQLNRIFEITGDGKIMWDGFCERYLTAEKKWTNYPQYRVSSASSLYPIWFSFRFNEVGKRKGELLIVNNGSEADTYTIYLKTKANKIVEKYETNKVPANGSWSKILNFKRKDLMIEVISANNPGLVKKLEL